MRRRGTLTGQPGEGNVTLGATLARQPCQGQPELGGDPGGGNAGGGNPGGGNPGRGKTGQPGGVAIKPLNLLDVLIKKQNDIERLLIK